MSVIPLTLTLSLCLVFTFLIFFIREHSRSRMSSSERDAMLPFLDEKRKTREAPSLVISFKDKPLSKQHAHKEGSCSDGKADHERCPDCPGKGKC